MVMEVMKNLVFSRRLAFWVRAGALNFFDLGIVVGEHEFVGVLDRGFPISAVYVFVCDLALSRIGRWCVLSFTGDMLNAVLLVFTGGGIVKHFNRGGYILYIMIILYIIYFDLTK
jgi:hypothetical protein